MDLRPGSQACDHIAWPRRRAAPESWIRGLRRVEMFPLRLDRVDALEFLVLNLLLCKRSCVQHVHGHLLIVELDNSS